MSDSQFESVLRENGPRVYTLAVRLTGNLSDGQDLAQETFLKAYENWERFRHESSAATWLYRICINLWKNRVRYEKRRSFWKHFSLSSADGEPFDLPSQDPPMGQAQEAQDQHRQLETALRDLEEQERAILILREVENRSYEDIADLLDIPVGTVRSRLSRAREKLRHLFLKDAKPDSMEETR